MQASPGQTTAPAAQAMLRAGSLAGAWALDPAGSSVALKTKVMGLIPVNGVFRAVAGAGTIGPDGEASGTITVEAASIDTRNARRDEHLRSADLLDTGRYPRITFTADRISLAGDQATVTGTLTVHGQQRPVSVSAAASVRGEAEVCLDAKVRVNRADFGISWNPMGLASVSNVIVVHATFVRATAR
jgi:polyisoprenoid-binding protein YceI